MSKTEEKKSKKIKMSTLFLSAFIFILFFIILLAGVVYRFNDRVYFLDRLSKTIPFPAILIDKTTIITIKEISENLNAIKKFYESQDFASLGYRVDFKTDEGEKRLEIRERELINKMIEDRIIEKIAKEKGISITDKLVNESVDRKISEYGRGVSIEDNLEKLYGWSLSNFKKKIVKPSLYKDELEKWVSENENKEENKKAKELVEKAMSRINSGENFSVVAKESSNGYTSDNGGHLGWFKKEYMAPELQDSVSLLNEGVVSEVLESKLGYHIIKMENKKNNDSGEELFNLSQIYFPKASFADWLSEKIKEFDLNILIGKYEWNAETGMIEFQDRGMRKFEEKALEEKTKDPSLLSI